jgi:ATP-dependent helicase/nuclease subunit B
MTMTQKQRLILSSLENSMIQLISKIQLLKQNDPFQDITILLPSTNALRDFRKKVDSSIAIFFLQFYSLADAILEEAASPVALIKDATIRQIISKILEEMGKEGQLSSFSPVQEKPGFITVLLEWIRELKSQGIHPEDYQAFAFENPSLRDAQLAEFYRKYQDYLQENGYADPDGRLWVAAEALEQNPDLFIHDGPLFVLGHDQFTPVEIRILKSLANRFDRMTVYLHWSEARDENDLALTRLRETRDALLNNLSLEILSLPGNAQSNATFSHLGNQLFALSPETIEPSDTVQLIEAPSREVEVRIAIKFTKRLMIEGISPDKIGILAPKPESYLPIIRTVGEEYAVPIAIETPLNEEPLVQELINLLQLAPDFNWQSTFQALRSPYIQQPWLSLEQIDQLDRLSREQPVLEGRQQWLSALRPIQETFPDLDDEDLGHPPYISTLSEEEIQSLRNGLKAFFDHLTPPTQGTVHQYAWWIQARLLGIFSDQDNLDEISPHASPNLQLFECCKGSPRSEYDLEVLENFLSCLRELIDAQRHIDQNKDIKWEAFCQELIPIIKSKKIEPEPHLSKVAFGPLASGRERLFDHMIILGLSEGEFPSSQKVDVFYSPGEREDFPLPIRHQVPAHDASLFWQVINNVQDNLTLLRPYLDENGAEWQPSPFWDALTVCFDDLPVMRVPIAEKIEIDKAASLPELLVASAQAHAQVVPDEIKSLYNYARLGERIHDQRSSYQPPGRFEGILQSDDLVRDINQRYHSTSVWSASRLNTYGNCPYNFFADNLLGLKARSEPEDGLDPMQRGSLLHALLEKTLGKLQEKGLRLAEENSDKVLAALDASCDEVFPSAHLRYGFQPTPLWTYEQEELHRLLKVYLAWECTENQGRYQPLLQEAKFGIKDSEQGAFLVEFEEDSFYLRGVIDRVDKDDHGNLLVIDYKSGSTYYSKDSIEKGLALQTALYALAAQDFWAEEGEKISKSEYRHLPNRSTSGSLKFDDRVEDNETVQKAVEKACEYIQRIRKGIFPSATEKPIRGQHSCTSYCDFAPLCRVSRQSISKARKAGLK